MSKKKSEKILKYSKKELFTKTYALDRILEHLKSNADDPRKRERIRVMVATKKINSWIEMGKEEYEKLCKRNTK